MEKLIYFTLLLFVALPSCDNASNKKHHGPIPRFVNDSNRVCQSDEADTFYSMEQLVDSFHALHRHKDSFELYLWYGIYYYQHGEYDLSLASYEKAKKIDSSQAHLYFDMCLTLTELKEYPRALEYANRATDICGDTWKILNSKCFILGKLDRCEEAIESGVKSYQLNPNNKRIYGNLMDCFDKLEMKDSIYKYYDLIKEKFGVEPERFKKLKAKYNYP